MKQLIIEGRYDSLVTKLSNKLLGIVKNSYASTQSEDGKFSGVKIHYKQGEDIPNIEGADSEGIDLQKEIMRKIKINKKRPYKHGKKF